MATYATTIELATYASDRGITITGDASTLLVKAHDYIESFNYIGAPTSSTQENKHPRTGMIVDGVAIPSDSVAQAIKNAEMAAAIEIDAGVDVLATVGRAVKKKKTDVIETEYMDNAAESPKYTKVLSYLNPFLVDNQQTVAFDMLSVGSV